MQNAVCCRTRGCIPTAMLSSLVRSSAKAAATQEKRPSPIEARLDSTTDVFRTTSAEAR
jgi:hypothetical protein